MNAITNGNTQTHPAGKAAWIILGIAWLCFLLPLPGIGIFVGWPLNLVAFVLAIVAMAKGGATKGLFQLILSLVASPIVYFIGVSILAMGVNAAAQTSAPKANTSNTSATAELTDSAVKAPPAAVPISVSAEQLYSAYAENEISADARFKGKSLLISGKVQSIQSGIGDDPVVQLAAGTFQWVQLHGLSKDVAAGLSKGQQILVRCKGQGETIGFPSAAECQLQ